MSAEPSSAAPGSAEAAPDDANDLRGFHFKLLLGKPLTWIVIALFVLAAGIAGGRLPRRGDRRRGRRRDAARLAAGRLRDRRLARRRRLLRGLRRPARAGPLRPERRCRRRRRCCARATTATPSAPSPARSPTASTASLALYTYEDETTDSKGNRQTNYYRYTVGLVEVPECAAHVPELYCQRKSGLRALEKLEDAFRSKQRVKLESEALDERYEIFAGKEQDQVWLRRLFSPTFIVWLGEEAPEKFAFELVGGTLCCYVNGHKKNAAELDTIRAATAAVARRLREEPGTQTSVCSSGKPPSRSR